MLRLCRYANSTTTHQLYYCHHENHPTYLLQTYAHVIAPADGVLDVPSRVLEFTAVGFCYRIMLTSSNKTGGVKVDIELKEEESWETISGKFFFSVHFAC